MSYEELEKRKEMYPQEAAVNPVYFPIPANVVDDLRAVNHWEIIEQASCPNLQYEFEVYV